MSDITQDVPRRVVCGRPLEHIVSRAFGALTVVLSPRLELYHRVRRLADGVASDRTDDALIELGVDEALEGTWLR